MNATLLTWQSFRLSRWLCWLGFLGYCAYVFATRESQVNSFGHLPHSTELRIFGLAWAAVAAGMLEVMWRGKAGLARPSFGQLIPPRATAP